MAEEKSRNIFLRFFREMYYRFFALAPKSKTRFSESNGLCIIVKDFKDKDREKIFRYLSSLGLSSDYLNQKIYFDSNSDKYRIKFKVAVIAGNGDKLDGICIDAFNMGLRYLPLQSVELVLDDLVEEKLREKGYMYLCTPHEVGPNKAEITFSEDLETIYSSFTISSKQNNNILDYNWNKNTGIMFLLTK